ncbi:MAG: putative sulfate exporter family transporter [Salinarimonas sp.]|nr:putative sulfate exporter family transporter [Salinarimonas sp.]
MPQSDARAFIQTHWPGLALSLVVAIAAMLLAPRMPDLLPLPAMVIALLIGVALNPLAARPLFEPGMGLAVKRLLRIAVALLGLRIALGDIVALGLTTALIVIFAMVVTVISGFAMARLMRQETGYGALAGAATAVCGASATLATATVVPQYKGKEADIAFVVVAVNALSTLAMVIYPVLGAVIGLDERNLGILIGATIHDVAQVVGAGYAISPETGDTAVIVKLFRVFLLLPVVLVIGWYFAARSEARVAGAPSPKVPVPVFAIVFLILCVVNSIALTQPALAPFYEPVRTFLVAVSQWGLLIAIAALGLGTSVRAIAALGWRHALSIVATTIVILVVAGALIALLL